MSTSDLGTLFVDWWNFPGAMEDRTFGLAKSLEDITDEVSAPRNYLSVPFLSSIIEKTTKPQSSDGEADDPIMSVGGVSLLDRYLLSHSSTQTFVGFENVLGDDENCFVLTLESGKKISGSLADLCAVRLAGIICHRPSPVFYDENYEDALGKSIEPTETVVSPQLWLPTKSGYDARLNALDGQTVPGVPLFLYFLSGNYLTDLHGYLPPTSHSPEQWRDSLVIAHSTGQQKNLAQGRAHTPARKARRPLWEPVRLGLLASIFLSRKIMAHLPKPLGGLFRAIDSTSQPWRGNSFLSKSQQQVFQLEHRVREVGHEEHVTT